MFFVLRAECALPIPFPFVLVRPSAKRRLRVLQILHEHGNPLNGQARGRGGPEKQMQCV